MILIWQFHLSVCLVQHGHCDIVSYRRRIPSSF